MTKASYKLRLSYSDCVSNSKLSVTVTAPRPQFTITCQSQCVLRANGYVIYEMTSNGKHLLWAVVTTGTGLWLTNQPI